MFKFLLEALKNGSCNIASQRQNQGFRSFHGQNKQRKTQISSSKFKNLNIEWIAFLSFFLELSELLLPTFFFYLGNYKLLVFFVGTVESDDALMSIPS